MEGYFIVEILVLRFSWYPYLLRSSHSINKFHLYQSFYPDFENTSPRSPVNPSIYELYFYVRASITKLWQKTAHPTLEAKFLNPLKKHLLSLKARFKTEIVPSMPARKRWPPLNSSVLSLRLPPWCVFLFCISIRLRFSPKDSEFALCFHKSLCLQPRRLGWFQIPGRVLSGSPI